MIVTRIMLYTEFCINMFIIDCIIWPHDILINYYRPTCCKKKVQKKIQFKRKNAACVHTQLFCTEQQHPNQAHHRHQQKQHNKYLNGFFLCFNKIVD